MIKINTGHAKLQNGSFKIIHTIEIEAYETAIKSLEATLNSSITSNYSLYPVLSYEILRIKTYLDRLRINNRFKRSLDFIGSTWKWIAGNPDHHDYEIITDKMNNVLKNNNNQVIINKMSIDKINELTNITNKILKVFKEKENNSNEIIMEIKYKLDVIKEELVNVAYAIHWAKANIINSFILSNTEINIIESIFKAEDIPYINIDEALEFAEIKIATNNKNLIYILSFPTTKSQTCNLSILKAVKINRVINKIKYDSILECNEEIYGIVRKCKTYNSLSICSSNNIVDLRNSSCIPKLIRSQKANCTIINNEHIPEIEEVTPGILLLNQFNGPVLINNETVMLKGTFIIKHFNTTIEINGKVIATKEITQYQPLPAILQPSYKQNKIEEVLSLERVKELYLNRTKEISLLETKRDINLSMNIILIVAVSIIIFLACRKRNKNNQCTRGQPTININQPATTTIGLDDIPHLLTSITSNEDARI